MDMLRHDHKGVGTITALLTIVLQRAQKQISMPFRLKQPPPSLRGRGNQKGPGMHRPRQLAHRSASLARLPRG